MSAIKYGNEPTGKSKFEKLTVEATEQLQQAEQAWVEGDRASARRHLAAAQKAQSQLAKLVTMGAG